MRETKYVSYCKILLRSNWQFRSVVHLLFALFSNKLIRNKIHLSSLFLQQWFDLEILIWNLNSLPTNSREFVCGNTCTSHIYYKLYLLSFYSAVGHPGRPSSRSINLLSNVQRRSGSVSRPPEQPTKKLKGSVWAFFAIIVFVLAIAKFYFNGVNMGMEALAFCSLLVVILIVGGLVSLYEALTTTAAHTAAAAAMEQIPEQVSESFFSFYDFDVQHNNRNSHFSLMLCYVIQCLWRHYVTSMAPRFIVVIIIIFYQEQSEELHQHVPSPTSVEPSPCELPPPPYHVAVNLPSHTRSSRESVRDSPPPSYDKAII